MEKGGLRVVHLGKLSPGDKRLIKKQGLSRLCLTANQSAVDTNWSMPGYLFKRALLKLKSRLSTGNASASKNAVAKAVNRTRFQHIMAETGLLYAICPSTGRLLRSSQSFIPTPTKWTSGVAFRFEGGHSFYIITHCIGRYFQKLCLYIPGLALVFLFDDTDFIKEEIGELEAFLSHHGAKVTDYVRKSSRQKPRRAVLISSMHFAHHLWNELSGLQALQERKTLARLERIYVIAEPLGPIEKIFPEIDPSIIARMDVEHFEGSALSGDYFIFRAGGNFIKEALADRVRRVSLDLCSAEQLAAIELARKEGMFPLIWISVRTSNRTWTSQIDGISSLLGELAHRFPSPGVVFDGFSIPYQARVEFSESLKEEIAGAKRVAGEIKSRLPSNVRVFDTIGCRLYESIAWSYAVDLYIAPFGSIQHKIGWIANKPGVVHCNRKCAAAGRSHQTFYARENCREPLLVAGETRGGVIRRPGDLRDNLDNYEIEWRDLYKGVTEVLRSITDAHAG